MDGEATGQSAFDEEASVVVVLVLQHVAVEGPGRIAAALDRAGRATRIARLDLGEPVPVGPAGLEGLVVMGGPMGVGDADEHPHLRGEMDLLADCVDVGLPVLGICLGSQLLAAALGAEVRPAGGIELGWLPVQLLPAAADDPLLGPLPDPFPALHWHGDVLDLPPGAVPLARSERTAVQAFRVGRAAYGLLFHLEAEPAQVAAMAEAFPPDVVAAGLTPGALLGSAPEVVGPLADALFDRWVALLP
jgi:GMP synthase-like glutamine amidotransferase